MQKRSFIQTYASSQEMSLWICNILLAIMMACLGFGVGQLGMRFNPTWHGGYFTWLCLLVAIEALYSKRHVEELEEERDRRIFRAAELLTITILIKIFLLIKAGPANLISEIPLWQKDFFGHFMTAEFIVTLIFTFFTWAMTTWIADELEQLHDRERDATWDELGKLQNALHSIRGRIISQVIAIGGVVVIMAIVARTNFREYIPIAGVVFNPSIPVLNVLLYAVLTLALLSQTQLALLRTRWLWAKTPISPRLSKNWVTYGIFFLIVFALFTFLMPTEYSLGLFDTIRYLLNLFAIISQALLFLLVLPFTLCAQLFRAAPQTTQTTPAPTQPPPILGTPPSQPAAWWQLVQSILFWGGLVSIVGFALYQYIRLNTSLWARLMAIPFFRWIMEALGSIWNLIRGFNREIVQFFERQIQQLQASNLIKEMTREMQSGRHRRLSPRERIMALYLNLLKVGGSHGFHRRDSQTPYQYSQEFTQTLPEVSPEMVDLTEAFVEARYSEHPVQEERLNPLQLEWERIKDAIHHWKEKIKNA